MVALLCDPHATRPWTKALNNLTLYTLSLCATRTAFSTQDVCVHASVWTACCFCGDSSNSNRECISRETLSTPASASQIRRWEREATLKLSSRLNEFAIIQSQLYGAPRLSQWKKRGLWNLVLCLCWGFSCLEKCYWKFVTAVIIKSDKKNLLLCSFLMSFWIKFNLANYWIIAEDLDRVL
jgi:hypothetical protein